MRALVVAMRIHQAVIVAVSTVCLINQKWAAVVVLAFTYVVLEYAAAREGKPRGGAMWRIDRRSEFELQAELFHRLRSAGYDVRGEVKFRAPGQRGVRADLLILRDGRPALIVEVKRQHESRCTKNERYTTITGLPCIVIDGARASNVLGLVDAALTGGNLKEGGSSGAPAEAIA